MKQYTVMKFGSSWCGPCKKLSQDIEKNPLSLDNVKYMEIDIENNDEMVEQYGIMSIPCTIILDNQNNEVSRKVGYPGLKEYINWIKNNINYE